MSKYPSISKGLGKLTPLMWQRLMRMLEWYEAIARTGESGANKIHKPYFLAKITASTAIGGTSNRYNYTWSEVELDNASSFGVKTGGRSGTTALNTCEMSNTAADVGPGVAVDAPEYVASEFEMMPIGTSGDDGTIDVVVLMFHVRDEDGNIREVFSMANSHDGTCT
tara:strand:- start:286 stop:786 length:501 start_codon:yes stop_codon:yes gene_type:complete